MKFRRQLAAIICALLAARCLSEEYFVTSRMAALEDFRLETGAPTAIGIDMPIYAAAMFFGVFMLTWAAIRLAKLKIFQKLTTMRLLTVVPFPLALLGLIPLLGIYAVLGAALSFILGWFTRRRAA